MGYYEWNSLEDLRCDALDSVREFKEKFPALLERITKAAVEVLGERVLNGFCRFSLENIHSTWYTAVALFCEEDSGEPKFDCSDEQVECVARLLAILRGFGQLMCNDRELESDDSGVWLAVYTTMGDLWDVLDWEQSEDNPFIFCVGNIFSSLMRMYDNGVLKFLTGTGEDWDSKLIDNSRREFDEYLNGEFD